MERKDPHWSLEEIKALSTDEIMQQLKNLGLPCTEEQFLEEIKDYHSPREVAEKWIETYSVKEGLDKDFLYPAASVLWERLAPPMRTLTKITPEQLDDMIQKGYDLLRENMVTEACDLWLEAWEHLKPHFSPEMKSIDKAEDVFLGAQSLYNWCQDLEMELGNAGLDDRSYFERRINYAQEFCVLFPESDRLLMENMKRAEAESCFALGRGDQGEQIYSQLVERYPRSAWAYIGWADQYWLFPFDDNMPPDYEKAEKIYRMALEGDVDDKDAVRERLEDLAERRKG